MKKVKVRRVKPPNKKKADQRELIGFVTAIVSLTTSIIAFLTALLNR